MKKIKRTAFMAIIGLGIVFFYGCQKDIENTDLKSQTSLKTKSMGNHQQPTQVIEINTTINIQNVEYPVAGNAIVGNFDGRIYESSLMWEVHLDEINEDFPLHLTATLKPEFEDLTIEVEPLMENYIITVNDNHVEPNFILVENGIEVVDYNAIFELWVEVVEVCNENMEIVYPFILNESMLPYQYAVYEYDTLILYEYIQTTLDNYSEIGKSYFTLFFNEINSLLYYGFVTESNVYFDPIWCISENDNLCFKVVRKEFDTFSEAWKYAIDKVSLQENNSVNIYKDKNTGKYIVAYDDGEHPVHP